AGQLFEAAQKALARAKSDGGNQIAFEPVHATMLSAVADTSESDPSQGPVRLIQRAARQRRQRGPVWSWLRAHLQATVLCGLGMVGLAVCLTGSIAELDWAVLAVMLSLAALAGLAFYFKNLPLVLALAIELNR